MPALTFSPRRKGSIGMETEGCKDDNRLPHESVHRNLLPAYLVPNGQMWLSSQRTNISRGVGYYQGSKRFYFVMESNLGRGGDMKAPG